MIQTFIVNPVLIKHSSILEVKDILILLIIQLKSSKFLIWGDEVLTNKNRFVSLLAFGEE